MTKYPVHTPEEEEAEHADLASAPTVTFGEMLAGSIALVSFGSQLGTSSTAGSAFVGLVASGAAGFALNRLRRADAVRTWAANTVSRLEASGVPAPLRWPVRYLPVPPAGCQPLMLAAPEAEPEPAAQPRPEPRAARTTAALYELFGEDVPTARNERLREAARSSRPIEQPRPSRELQNETRKAPRKLEPEVDELAELDATLGVKPAKVVGPPSAGPLPLKQWVPFADSRPHLLLAAKTGGGKSTLAKFFLRARILRGEKIFIIDPHWSPHNWWGLPGAGGGEDFEEVREALLAVSEEYRNRIQALKRGKRTEDFTRLTILVDEVVITKTFFDSSKIEGPNGKPVPDDTWERFIKVLGSGARKVAVSVILMTQSPNVDDLGVSGPLRENYARICLDARTVRQLIKEDADRERRDALRELLPDQGEYPAVMEMNGEVFFLNRTKVVDVAKPAGADNALWDGWDYGTVDTDTDEDEYTEEEIFGTHRTDARTHGTVPSVLPTRTQAGTMRTDPRTDGTHGTAQPPHGRTAPTVLAARRPVATVDRELRAYPQAATDDALLAQLNGMPVERTGTYLGSVKSFNSGSTTEVEIGTNTSKKTSTDLPATSNAENDTSTSNFRRDEKALIEAKTILSAATSAEKQNTGRALKLLTQQGESEHQAVLTAWECKPGRVSQRGQTLLRAVLVLREHGLTK